MTSAARFRYSSACSRHSLELVCDHVPPLPIIAAFWNRRSLRMSGVSASLISQHRGKHLLQSRAACLLNDSASLAWSLPREARWLGRFEDTPMQAAPRPVSMGPTISPVHCCAQLPRRYEFRLQPTSFSSVVPPSSRRCGLFAPVFPSRRARSKRAVGVQPRVAAGRLLSSKG